jgi:hypothetical protein
LDNPKSCANTDNNPADSLQISRAKKGAEKEKLLESQFSEELNSSKHFSQVHVYPILIIHEK